MLPSLSRRPPSRAGVVPSSRAGVVPATGAVLGSRLGGTFTHTLYPALYGETTESSRRGYNGPIFARGKCGGGNANGGAFRAETPHGRPETAHQLSRSMPRLDNLGNVSYLVSEKTQRQSSLRSSPFRRGPEFAARLVAPGTGRPSTALGALSCGSPASAPSRYAQSQNSIGDFRAVRPEPQTGTTVPILRPRGFTPSPRPGPSGLAPAPARILTRDSHPRHQVSRVATPFATWRTGTAALPRDAPASGTPRDSPGFYGDAGCTQPVSAFRTNNIFNPLATR